MGMWTIQITDTATGETQNVLSGKERLRIGSLKSSDIQLEKVGRMHGTIELVDPENHPQVCIYDFGSSLGTFINGSKITEHIPLYEGDLIQIGQYTLRVQHPELPKATTRPLSAPESTPAKNRFYFDQNLFWERGERSGVQVPSAYAPQKGDCWVFPNGDSLVILTTSGGVLTFLRSGSETLHEIPAGAHFIAFVRTRELIPEGRILFQDPRSKS
jgi:pSer/pThr/pTyr-binding forkhead associated (FHA) protein